jgi:hypothetical protein
VRQRDGATQPQGHSYSMRGCQGSLADCEYSHRDAWHPASSGVAIGRVVDMHGSGDKDGKAVWIAVLKAVGSMMMETTQLPGQAVH